MDKIKLLVFGHKIEGNYVEGGGMYIDALVGNGALFFDYEQIYEKYGFNGSTGRILGLADENKADAVLFFTSPREFMFPVDLFDRLRKQCFVIMQTGDTEHYFEIRDRYYAQAVDLVIATDYAIPAKLGQMGIDTLLYFGYTDPATLKRDESVKKDVDISFIGTISGKVKRQYYIDLLKRNGFNVLSYGTGSPLGMLSFEDKVKLYNRTKINLNLSGIAETTTLTRNFKIHRHITGIKGNLFEATLCGGFVLSEHAFGLENLYAPEREFAVFYDEEELLEKVKYYLTHDREREAIAQNGFKRAHSEPGYNVKTAVPLLLGEIGERMRKKKFRPVEIYQDEEFLKYFSTYRLVWVIRFLIRFRFLGALRELAVMLKIHKINLYVARVYIAEEILDKIVFLRKLKQLFKGWVK